MWAHVVLFDLRPDLTVEERGRFIAALRHALTSIPSIRRHVVGRRQSIGAGYETAAAEGFGYLGVLEFDDRAGLEQYLAHPAHQELGALFWSCSSRTLVLDVELAGPDLARTFAEWA